MVNTSLFNSEILSDSPLFAVLNLVRGLQCSLSSLSQFVAQIFVHFLTNIYIYLSFETHGNYLLAG